MHVRPQIVYKYKSISTQTDFNRVVDIIKVIIFICQSLLC